MISTAIYQGPQGQLTYARYNGHISRKDAWLSAAKLGGTNGNCLVALVPGDHPVYFYENFVKDNAAKELSEMQQHDLYEIPRDTSEGQL